MEFSEKLQLLRGQRGLTQEELAAEIFVSRTAVSKWESGRGYPSIDSLKALAGFFDVTVDVLISEKELSEMGRRMREREWSLAARISGIACGVLDICALVFLFMPLFKMQAGCIVWNVSILKCGDSALRTLYLIAIFGTVILGCFTLMMQAIRASALNKALAFLSPVVGLGLLLLFIAGSLPYAAAVALLLLVIKAFFLIKQW